MIRLTRVLLTLSATFFAAVVIAACAGSSPIDVGDDDDAATARLPSLALWTSNWQPFLTAGAPCAGGGCHLDPSGQNGYDLRTGVAPADVQFNIGESACSPRMTAFSNGAAGLMLSKFCTDATTPVVGGHSGRVASAADCTRFYDWARSGGIGTVPPCASGRPVPPQGGK